MRLIDADALLHEIGELKKSPWYNDNTNGARVIRSEAVSIIEQVCIQDAPTIDAVEVVRCKDCKHRFNGEHHDNCCDVLMEKVKWTFEVTVEPDWFCADGKKRTD